MDTGLSQRDKLTINDILSKYSEIKAVRLFGSRAKGNFKPGSDIDLVIMNKQVDSITILRLLSDFEESTLPYFVDVIHYPSLQDSSLKEHIDRISIPFYSNQHFSQSPT